MNPLCQPLSDAIAAGSPQVAALRDRDSLEERLRHLPMAHPQQATAELAELLEGMLALPWSGSERLQALQALARPLASLHGGLSASIGRESHPLPATKARAVAGMAAVQQRTGEAFAKAACELVGRTRRPPLLARRKLVTALSSALAHQHQALLLTWELGRTPPARLWQCVHATWRLASGLGLAERPATVTAGEGETSADERYLGILLLAMGNPYAWQHRELLQVAGASRVLAPHARLQRLAEQPLAVMSSGPDSGPGYVDAEQVTATPDALALDLAPALAQLEEQLAGHEDTAAILLHARGGNVELPTALAVRLGEAWRGSAPRIHRRLPARHALVTLPGLRGLHRELAGQEFESYARRVTGAQLELGSDADAAAWVSAGEAAETPRFEARVLDQSMGGYRLCWTPDPRLRLRVGELLGLAPEPERQDAEPWLLGLVRWLRADSEQGLMAGVSLLACEACAAVVRCVDEDGRRGRVMRALLLRDDRGKDALVVTHLVERGFGAVDLGCMESRACKRPAMRNVRRQVERVAALGSAYDRIVLAPPAKR